MYTFKSTPEYPAVVLQLCHVHLVAVVWRNQSEAKSLASCNLKL